MASSWAVYGNEEHEVDEFATWIGKKTNDWAERKDGKWMIDLGGTQIIFPPYTKKLLLKGNKEQVCVLSKQYKDFIQADQKSPGGKIGESLKPRRH